MRDDYGVRYLVIDRLNGYPADEDALTRSFPTVYETSGVRILELNAAR